MTGVNKVILIGNLGRDPEMRYTQSQQPVASFSVATSDRWQDRATGETQERTEWHRVVCFRRLAEICGEYLRKGSKVYIEGSLQTRQWDAQDGQKRYTTEIVARNMQMLDSRGGGGGHESPPPPEEPPFQGQGGEPPARSQRPVPAPEGAPPAADADFDDDIPF